MRLVSHPVLCNYYLTYRCNAKCSFCDIWEQPSPYVTLKDVGNNLRDLKKLGVKVIDFTGGEPLLHQELPEILKMAKDLGFITTITTNTLLYPKKAKDIAGLVDMLHFSLDSYDKDEHDQMRGVACYDSLMKSIDIALELGERPDILTTVFSSNFKQIEPIYNHVAKPNNLVLILNPAFDYNNIETGPTLSKQQLSDLKKWGKKPLVYLNNAMVDLIYNGGNHVNKPICLAGSTTIVISPFNELIAPCYHLNKEQFPISANLADLYQHKEVQNALAKEGVLPECEGCTINCYMQPSFAVKLNKYFFKAFPSTIKYNKMKGTWKELFS
ncbi:MAG: radical SAM protein [Bacteroidota bacterium]